MITTLLHDHGLGQAGWSGGAGQAQVVEVRRRRGCVAAHRAEADLRLRAGRQGPGALPGPVDAVRARPGAVALLAGGAVDGPGDPQPGRRPGRSADVAAVRQAAAVRDFLAE